MIKILLTPILFLNLTVFCYDDNQSLLKSMFDINNWEVVNKHSDSLIVFKKRLDGVDIPAFKATMISSVPMSYIMNAIADGENHEKFMGSSHVVASEFIGDSSSDTTYSYQMLDLPIISDRHYITTNFNDTVSVDHYRMNWMIDNDKNQRDFKKFIDVKDEMYGNPIFVKDGVGSWELKRLSEYKTEVSYYVLINPGGWIPNRLITYVNKSLGPDTVIMMVKEGARRYKLGGSPRYILFTLAPSVPELFIERIQNELVVRNNVDIQIMLNIYDIKSIEKWSAIPKKEGAENPAIYTYRIDVGPNKSEEINEIKDRINDLSVVLNAEVQNFD